MEGIEKLREAVDALVRLDPDTLTDDELGDTLIELHHLKARLAASKARLTAARPTREAPGE